jgi:hypothetical protein
MELNGVANLKILVDQIEELADSGMEVMPQALTPLVSDMKEQLILLQRYMLAYMDHAKSIKSGSYGALIVGVEEPLWHEVRENPENYPTGQERIDNFKKQRGLK